MKPVISERTYRAIYRLLDRVNPIDGDCGSLCGAECCTCSYEPEEIDFHGEGDVNADEYMGLFFLPGEEKIHQGEDDWLEWGHIQAEDYYYPDSWEGKIYFAQCNTSPLCPREKRPIQCRTFPLAPHIDEDGIFHVIMYSDELPYSCPLLEDDIKLNEDFIQATYTAWKHLLKDQRIYDLVEMDSEDRINEKREICILK